MYLEKDMKRIAVLIQSPLSGRDYLSGVGVDIACWQSFLTSLPGGAWNDDEIIVLKNPSKTTLKSSLILAKYSDFAMVVSRVFRKNSLFQHQI